VGQILAVAAVVAAGVAVAADYRYLGAGAAEAENLRGHEKNESA